MCQVSDEDLSTAAKAQPTANLRLLVLAFGLMEAGLSGFEQRDRSCGVAEPCRVHAAMRQAADVDESGTVDWAGVPVKGALKDS